MALTFGGKRKPGGMGPRTPLDPLEQQLTDRIAAVLRALRNSTDVDAYVHAIQALDPDALERLLARVEMGALGARIEETLRSVVITGGSAEGQRIIRETPRVPSPFEALQYPGSVLPSGIIVPPGLAPPPDVEFQVATQRPDLFEYVDRRATEYARTRAANLVVQVDSANRLAIRRVIHESFTQPATADQTARKLRSMVGLHTRWARAVMNFDDANYRRFLKDGMTQEAARARADVLTKRYSDRLIRRRAEMIARTEIQQAQNWGRQAAWDGGSKAGYVDMASMKEWRTAPMGSQYGPPCPICTELRGTRVPYNGTFANGYEMPPAHPHCRCTAVLVPPTRGLTGQPSQDMDSWLEQLDELDAESIAEYDRTVAKHGDPSRPGYAQLHPDSSPGSPLIGQSVGDWEDAWTTTLPTRLGDVRVVVDGVTLGRKGIVESEGTIVGPDGAEVGRWRRTFYPEDGVLYNDWLTIAGSAKGHGIAAEFYKHTERVAHRAGADRIVVSAASEGTRAWASERFGFEFSNRPPGFHPPHVKEFALPDAAVTQRLITEALDLRERASSANRADWPTPNEVLGLGADAGRMTVTRPWGPDGDTRTNSYTMGEWILSEGWDGEKPADRLTKAAGPRMLHLTVEGPTAPVRKHGDPSRPGYAALHPSSRTGSATAPSLGHDGTPLPSGWSLLSAEDRVAERMRQRDAGYGDQSSREARDRRDGDLWEIRRQERALTVYEGAGGARVYLDRIPLADGEDHHVVSQSALRPILQQVDRLQSTDPTGDVDITVTAAAFRGRPPDVMGWALLGADRHTLTAERHSIRPSTQRIALNPTGVSKGGPVQQGHHGNLMPTSITHPDHYYLTHEWGHAIDVRASDQARNDHREIGDTPHLLDSLSSYGRSNEYESYAESFAEWTLSGGATSRAVARHFAEKYGWGTDAAVAKAAAGGPGRICVDTFTLDPGPTIEQDVVVKSLTRPLLKHGDPSRPGYAALHPDSKVSSLRARMADAKANGHPMGVIEDLARIERDWDTKARFAAGTADLPDASDWIEEHADELDLGEWGSDILSEAAVSRSAAEEEVGNRVNDWSPATQDHAVDVVDTLRSEGTVMVSAPTAAAIQILATGRIKSQFETGDSRGYFGPERRAQQEAAMLDIHPSVDARYRPVYGYVASREDDRHVPGASNYGEVLFEMRPSVRDRTTMTVGDSLGASVIPVPMTGRVTREQKFGAFVDEPFLNGGSTPLATSDFIAQFDRYEYTEVQITGGVPTSDIARIHFPRDRTIPPDNPDSAFSPIGGVSYSTEEGQGRFDQAQRFLDAAAASGIEVTFYDRPR